MIRSERYEDQLHMAGGQYGKYVNEQGQLMNHKSADTFLRLFVSYKSYKNCDFNGAKRINYSRTGLI